MFEYCVTANDEHVVLVLDDYTGKPQTWRIPRHAALQMSEMLADAARSTDPGAGAIYHA
jgi:hypothetical protein